MIKEFLKILKKRPILLDGAMGTMIAKSGQARDCNEELNLVSPEVIEKIHREYLSAGSDIITTNTFGASRISLEDYDLADRAYDINLAAAKIARRAADASKGNERFVAGDIGPTSKLPTLSHVSFDELFAAYVEQIEALINGGVDIILVETCQDPLQSKAALAALASVAGDIPAIVSVTMEKIGTMLLGTELSAALASIGPYRPFAFGLNCATGPIDMEEYLLYLSNHSPFPIICQPNAGLPEIKNGKAVYEMLADDFAEILSEFANRFGVSFLGGCCGTMPEHIEALSKRVRGIRPKPKTPSASVVSRVSSLFNSHAMKQEPRPFVIAEQTNVNGSKKFRELLSAEDFHGMSEVAKISGKASHALDVCLATPARDEARDFSELLKGILLKVDCPIMIDSTEIGAIERALALLPGRSIINSINFEDGGEKARRIFGLAKKYGACVVGLTIDEDGMAKDFQKKLDIAERIIELAKSMGFAEDDLLIDSLTFTLASGDKGQKNAALETLRAVSEIKGRHPEVNTLLGVSNISFGLPVKGRKYLTSVFLNRAVERGLDAAIINPKKIVPMHAIPEDILALCNGLIDADDSNGDPLSGLLEILSEMPASDKAKKAAKMASMPPRERLHNLVIEGSQADMNKAIDELLVNMAPRDIINEVLLSAMQEVGRRFSDGKLPLPFVLESAEAMRAAIDLITPHMHDDVMESKGTLALATVRGDVHDIGKNLVDAILSNNGYKVFNLGIRQSAASIMGILKKNEIDAIGLSGLLVSSTEMMREDIITFADHGISIPVLCGGAALTEEFVDKVLRPKYEGDVYYCRDAFDGFKIMEEISSKKKK